MKHTKKKRLLAIVLCMILVLSTGIAAFANENVGLQSVACQAATLERVMKNADGEEVGTLIADIPEGALLWKMTVQKKNSQQFQEQMEHYPLQN